MRNEQYTITYYDSNSNKVTRLPFIGTGAIKKGRAKLAKLKKRITVVVRSVVYNYIGSDENIQLSQVEIYKGGN